MASAKLSRPMPVGASDYEAEDDHRTLTRAEDVRADPARMKRVAAFHRSKMRSMSKIGASLQRRTPSRGRP